MDTTLLEQNSNYDLVIVGSGLSGLTTATRVLQADPKKRVMIVDAENWFGGRTRSIQVEDSKVSIGGTFSLFEHNDTLALAAEIGCYPTETLHIADVNFKMASKDMMNPIGVPLFIKLLYKGSKVVDSKSGKIDWNCSTAKKLDKVSLEGWIQEQWILNKLNPNFTREFFYLLETYPDLSTVSALLCAVQLWVRFRGIPKNGFEIPPKVLRWDGGTGVFTEALVENLKKLGGNNFHLQLNSPVQQISQPKSIVNKSASSGSSVGEYPMQIDINENREEGKRVTINAKYVVVATNPMASAPLHQGGTIVYEPQLDPRVATLFSAVNPTPTVSMQILVVYKNKWWKELGVAINTTPEYTTHLHEKGVWGNIVDGSEADPKKVGVVRIFCDSRRVKNWTDEAIKASAIDFLCKMLPNNVKQVNTFSSIILHDWNTAKPALPGVTFTYPPAPNGGVLSQYGQLFTLPHGRIHWGGSERSVWGANWMEGAIERGNDVASEILQAASWASPKYNVRKPRPTLRLSSDKAVMFNVQAAQRLTAFAEEDGDAGYEELEEAPQPNLHQQEWEPLEGPLALSDGLQPGPERLPVPQLDATLATATAPEHIAENNGLWVSPQQCLDALRELDDARERRKASKARENANEEEEESEPQLESAPVPVPERRTPIFAAEPEHLQSYTLIEETPRYAATSYETPRPIVGEKLVPVQAASPVQPFLLGLALGVFVTVATVRLGSK